MKAGGGKTALDHRPGAVARRIAAELCARPELCYVPTIAVERWLARRIAAALRRAKGGGK
jgi:hypothetical protein